MTIAITDNKVQYTADGIQTDFPFQFRVLEEDHLIVTQTDGAGETTVVDKADYTVTGINEESGNVSFLSPPSSGLIITIYRSVPATQLTDYVEYDPFPAESHETALDKLTMICQQLQEQLDRAFLLPPESGDGTSLVLDLTEPYANTILTFDSTGTVLRNEYEIGNYKGEWQSGVYYRARQTLSEGGYSDLLVVINDHLSTNVDDDVASGHIVRALKFNTSNSYKWAQEEKDVQVNDGVHPLGYSSYHWSQVTKDYTDEALPRVRWMGDWSNGTTYQFSDMVFQDGWLMVANKETTDPAAPQPLGSLLWAYPENPAVIDQTHVGTVIYGASLAGLDGNFLVTGIRTWVPDVSATAEYRVGVSNNLTGEVTVSQTFYGNELASPGWFEVKLNPFWISANDDLSLVVLAQKPSGSVPFTHAWTYKRVLDDLAIDVGSGNSGRDVYQSTFLVSKTDNIGTDRSADLATAVSGSTLKIEDQVDPTIYISYQINRLTDHPTYVEYDVTLMETGAGGEPNADDVTNLTFGIKTAGTVTYPTVPDFHLGKIVRGVLQLDDGAPVYGDTGYGVDLLYQQYIISEDWDVASYMGAGSSSGSIGDAPADGLRYGRKDNAWIVLNPGLSEQPASFIVAETDGFDHWYSVTGAGVLATIPVLPLRHRFTIRCNADTTIDASAWGTVALPSGKLLAPEGSEAVIGFIVESGSKIVVFGDLADA